MGFEIGELFRELGHPYEEMKENSEISIADKNIKIKSYNVTTQETEYKKIYKLVRKSDSPMYRVFTISGHSLKCTLEHQFYTNRGYVNLSEIIKSPKDYQILDENSIYTDFNIEQLEGLYPVLDISVEGNRNYFTGGILSHNTDPTTTTGGNALKFYASNRMEVKKVTTNKTDDVAVSNRTRVRVIKNKMAPPFRNCEFNIEFGKGVDQVESTFTAGVEAGILIKKGNSYFIEDVNNPDMRIGKSYDESVNSMADDARRALVKQKILDKYRFEDGMDEMDTKTVSDDLRNIEQEIAQVASTTPPSETAVVDTGEESLIINPVTGEILDGTKEGE